MTYLADDPPPPHDPSAEASRASPWSTVSLYLLNLFFSTITAPIVGFATGGLYIHFFQSEESARTSLFGLATPVFLFIGLLLYCSLALILCTAFWLPLWINRHRNTIFHRPLTAAAWGALPGFLIVTGILLPWMWQMSRVPGPPSSGQHGELFAGILFSSLAASAAIPGALVFLISSLSRR